MVAKTPQGTTTSSTASITASATPSPFSGTAAPPSSSAAPGDPCAVNLASPTIAEAVSDLACPRVVKPSFLAGCPCLSGLTSDGSEPTVMLAVTVLVAALITDTVPSPLLVT
jgi:hypothetical protein